MREHLSQSRGDILAQDAQDEIGTVMNVLWNLTEAHQDSPHAFRTVYPPQNSPEEERSATYTPPQFGSIFPQLDITVSEQSQFAAEAPERQLYMSQYYDLIMDLGFAARAREVQLGSTAVYRYLQAPEGVVRGVSYRQYIALDSVKYFVPGGEVRGFRMIPEHASHRSELVSIQLALAALGEADVARVKTAVEWFKQP